MPLLDAPFQKSFVKSIIIGACVFAVAACSNGGTSVNSGTPSKSPSTPPAAPTSNGPQTSPIISDVVTQPIIEESEALPDINTLANLTPREIENLMGAPDLRREDGNVQVFLYESSVCVLEVILREDQNSELKSESVKTRDRKGASTDKTSCLTSILPDGWQN
jgi:hypothetical protein